MINILYDSRTGNVKRFVEKVIEQLDEPYNLFNLQDYVDRLEALTSSTKPIHLITYTTKRGELSDSVSALLRTNVRFLIKTVASSGNKNWGNNFALASKIIEEKLSIRSMQFELSGLDKDVKNYIKMVRDNS